MSKTQLSLNLGLATNKTFTNYFAESNQELVYTLRTLINSPGENFIYLWGEKSCGKSHILQACCNLANEHKLSSVYLPLAKIKLGPEVFYNLEKLDVVVVDDLEVIAKNEELQQQFFYLFNYIKDENHKLIIAANKSASQLGVSLKDLQSRLMQGASYKVNSIKDSDRIKFLQFMAYTNGLELEVKAAEFLLNRVDRDLNKLTNLFDILDKESFRQQRKLTIPFIKEVLNI